MVKVYSYFLGQAITDASTVLIGRRVKILGQLCEHVQRQLKGQGQGPFNTEMVGKVDKKKSPKI